MKRNWTKGEWKARILESPIIERAYVGAKDLILFEVDHTGNFREQKANAILSSAAPDMYEALEALYNAIDSCVDLTPELLHNAKKALNKANPK